MLSHRRAVARVILAAILLFFAPQVMLAIHAWGQTYSQVEEVPLRDYGVVFGAYVSADGRLSDAARERVGAGVALYRAGRVRKLYISGDNRSHRQADRMAAYAVEQGVAVEDVVIDELGIDTHDTCRHFGEVGQESVLITQGYHLPRAMRMCEDESVEVVGLAANRLGLLERRGENAVAIWETRVVRLAREAALTWAYLLGIYDRLSDEAEQMEQEVNEGARTTVIQVSAGMHFAEVCISSNMECVIHLAWSW